MASIINYLRSKNTIAQPFASKLKANAKFDSAVKAAAFAIGAGVDAYFSDKRAKEQPQKKDVNSLQRTILVSALPVLAYPALGIEPLFPFLAYFLTFPSFSFVQDKIGVAPTSILGGALIGACTGAATSIFTAGFVIRPPNYTTSLEKTLRKTIWITVPYLAVVGAVTCGVRQALIPAQTEKKEETK